MDTENLRIILGRIKELGVDTVCMALSDWGDNIAMEAGNAERAYAINCAAAAMVEAQIPDVKIAELLHKYYRLDAHETASALGEGRLMVANKRKIAKNPPKLKSQSKEK